MIEIYQINPINPDKYYSAKKVSQMGVLPWSSNMTFIKNLKDPYWAAIFNPIIEQKKNTKRFYIKGQNIIDFIQLAKEGKLK